MYGCLDNVISHSLNAEVCFRGCVVQCTLCSMTKDIYSRLKYFTEEYSKRKLNKVAIKSWCSSKKLV